MCAVDIFEKQGVLPVQGDLQRHCGSQEWLQHRTNVISINYCEGNWSGNFLIVCTSGAKKAMLFKASTISSGIVYIHSWKAYAYLTKGSEIKTLAAVPQASA